MQPVIHVREQLLLTAAVYTAYDGWSKLYANNIWNGSKLTNLYDQCCANGYNNTYECKTKVVELFGAGFSATSLQDLCDKTYWNLNSSTLLKVYSNIGAGLVGTAITIALMVVIGKRIATTTNKLGD